MKGTVIKTDKAPAPGGWYSQAYRAGNLIFTAGVTAADPVIPGALAPGDHRRPRPTRPLKNLESHC